MLKILILITLLSLHLFSKNLEKVNIQFQWKHQYQYAGFYAAVEKGFYKDIGLEVELKEWNYNVDIVNDLNSGKTTFAAVGSSDILGGIFNGTSLTIISSYLRRTPLALAVKPDIYFPSDLKGKKVMGVENDLRGAVFYNVWKDANMKVEDFQIIPHSFTLDEFIKGEVDAVEIYVTDQLYELASKNVRFNIIDNNNFATEFYDLMLVTSSKLSKENPVLVQKFKEATNKGWRYAFENKEEILDLILKKYNTQNKTREALSFEESRLKHLMLSSNSKIGEVEVEKLKEIAQVYLDMGIIKSIPNMKNHIFTYVNEHKKLDLSYEEINYLKNIDSIKVCAEENWQIDESNASGINHIAYLLSQKVSKIIDKPVTFVKSSTWTESLQNAKEGKCNLLPMLAKTEDRKEWLNFSKSYLTQDLVIATSNEHLYVEDFSQLENKTVAIVKNYAYIKDIRRQYPNLNLIEVTSPKEGLLKAQEGEIFGYIDAPVSLAFVMRNENLVDIKLVGKLDNVALNISMGVTKDDVLLSSIIEKAIDIIPKSTISKILNDFYTIKYEKGIDYDLVRKVILASVLLFLVMLYWNRKVKKANGLLEEAQKSLKLKNQELELISITDRLTGVYNRHKLDDVLEKEYVRYKRYKREFGIIILDIDKFKKINDTYGHLTGDSVLIELSDILKQTIRASDIVGRWGGEEFIIVSPETNLKGLETLAHKCRLAIASHKFKVVNSVTASFGVALYVENKTIDELILQADNCLYKAKENGRNRVEI